MKKLKDYLEEGFLLNWQYANKESLQIDMDTIAETNALGIICDECGEAGQFRFVPLQSPNGSYVALVRCKFCENYIEF